MEQIGDNGVDNTPKAVGKSKRLVKARTQNRIQYNQQALSQPGSRTELIELSASL